MELPNEYILSLNRKYIVQFAKSQKETQTTISPVFFSGGLGKCSKLKAKLKMKDGTQPIYKKKRNVLFAALEQINKELDILEQVGILPKTNFSEWAAPAVHLKKKVETNTNLRRFILRVKRCLAGSPLSSTKPWRNFQPTKH